MFLASCNSNCFCRNLWTIWTETQRAKSSRRKYHLWYLGSLQFYWRACRSECVSVNSLTLSLSLSHRNLSQTHLHTHACTFQVYMNTCIHLPQIYKPHSSAGLWIPSLSACHLMALNLVFDIMRYMPFFISIRFHCLYNFKRAIYCWTYLHFWLNLIIETELDFCDFPFAACEHH